MFLLLILGLCLCPPPLEEAQKYPTGGILYDSEGNVLRVTLGPREQDCRPLATLAEAGWCAKALIAAEDRRFHSHMGVDPLALLRACRQNLFSWRRVSGASTLTMQAVRLIRPRPRTFANKIRETFAAIRLDWAMPKEEILLNVLNRAPMGSNLVGVGAGAEGWFGKPAQNLGLAEAALLAGLAQSPTRLRPDRNLAGAVRRQHFVLDRMAALGMATAAQCADAKAQPLAFRRSPRPFHAPWFCDYVLRGRPGGAAVRTTLDPRVQRVAEFFVQPRPGEEGIDFAVVVVRVGDGALLAMSSSGDYFKQNVNLTDAPRAAGSTLKPFAFAMAFDQGKLARDTPLADEPLAFAGYVPSNFDNTFSRRVAAGDALVRSLNIPALHVLLMVGQPAFHRLLTGLGLTTLTRPAAHYGVGIVNGNAPVTLVELANAYALFGRGGKHLPLATTPGLASEPRAVFSPETARLVTDILSGPERAADATGHVADVELPRFAWKTGTSSGYRDAWAIAWNGQYVIGVWGGHRDGGNKNDGRVIGRRVATGRAWDVIRGIENQHSDFRTQNTEFRIQNGESFSAISHQPSALRIISPAPGTVFVVSDAHPVAMQKIAIRTYCEDAVVLHWFLDGVFQATQPSYAPLLFEPVPGAHVFTCTTDAGDFASVRIVVK